MGINATLFVQMIVFGLFVWFTMKLVWPPVMAALEERRDKIAQGLAAAERGQHDLEKAQVTIADDIRKAKIESAGIIDAAGKRASQMVEEAKDTARDEGKRLINLARAEIQQELQSAKTQLRNEVAQVALSGAEKILGREIDAQANKDILDKLIKEI